MAELFQNSLVTLERMNVSAFVIICRNISYIKISLRKIYKENKERVRIQKERKDITTSGSSTET